jgi:hypothetical protein
MDEFRRRGFIPWNKIDQFLRALRSIWVSTTRPDGGPHAVPGWYVWEERKLSFISERSLQKSKNLANQLWIVARAGSADDLIILKGPVEIVVDRAELESVDAAYWAKYVDPGSGAQATIFEPNVNIDRADVKHGVGKRHHGIA